MLDFTSIGTLFAFVLVCGGILLLPADKELKEKGKFRIPYINSQWIVPIGTIIAFILIARFYPNSIYLDDANQRLNYPMIIFYLFWAFMTVLAFIRKLSFIPLAGLLSCCYLLTGMGWTNWLMFGSWLIVGLILYFLYGYRKSHLT